MSRAAAVSADTIRATVLTMLAEAGDATPPCSARFRQIISVRKLRARLGAGDPATLSRHLNAIESELVEAGLAEMAVPAIPPAIAEQMRALWESAVAVQLDDVVHLKRDAAQAADNARAAQHEAELRVELLRAELDHLRDTLRERETELATLRAAAEDAGNRLTVAEREAVDWRNQLELARHALTDAEHIHTEAVTALHRRYEGLSRQLLQETAHQRDAWRDERNRLAAQLAAAEERLQVFDALRERLLAELASERDGHLDAATRANALAAVVTEQRRTLDVLDRRHRSARGAPSPRNRRAGRSAHAD
ncbi:DNA-binding protein [Burkholderia stagnalis]